MTPLARPSDAPAVAEIRRITTISDPVLRNLRITECYHRLSAAMGGRVAGSANWCTFATWASRQAGQTIRGEDLLDKLERRTREGVLHPIRALWGWLVRQGLFNPESRLGRVVLALHSPFDALELSSRAVARGNLKVFEEIGLEFARYLAECPPDAPVDSEAFKVFEQGLREGEPPEGQSLLRRAFGCYQRASLGDEGRAQAMLLANLLIGVHEQTRLQPEIREAMEAVPESAVELGELAVRALFPEARPGFLVRFGAVLLGTPAARLQTYVRGLTRRAVTDALMVLTLPPGVVLALDRHIDVPFPEVLKDVSDPELQQFLLKFEPAGGMRDDCGARDWSSLQQRVHYIVHLFRTFQERAELFTPPFTAGQVVDILSGMVPAGDL